MGLLGLYGAVKNAFTDAPTRDLEKLKLQWAEIAEQEGEDSPMVGMMDEMIATTENNLPFAKPLGYFTLVLSLVSLVGVWLMWNL